MLKKYNTDKSSATHIRLGVGILLHSKNKILLEKRMDCKNWGLIGGAVDIGERIEESIVRECYEETSICIQEKDLLLVGIYSDIRQMRIIHYPDNCFHSIEVIYSCEIDEEVKIRKSFEIIDVKFFYNYFLPDNLVPWSVEPINDFLRKNNKSSKIRHKKIFLSKFKNCGSRNYKFS